MYVIAMSVGSNICQPTFDEHMLYENNYVMMMSSMLFVILVSLYNY